MKGQKYKFYIFETKEQKDFSLHNNYTFSNMYEWDDYYYDHRNERIIKTSQIKIGYESH